MEEFLTLIVIALVIESVWETLKMLWQEGKVSVDKVGALITSLIVCVGARLDLFSLLGINIYIPFLGTVLTGILASRGSNFIHDLIEKITNVKEVE